jgi:hypothetical protein
MSFLLLLFPRKCQNAPQYLLEIPTHSRQNGCARSSAATLRASISQPLHYVDPPKSASQHFENARHAKSGGGHRRITIPRTKCSRPQNHFKPLHLQNLRFRDLDGRTMDIVGTSLPENQHAMVLCLVVGLARWDSLLDRRITIPQTKCLPENQHAMVRWLVVGLARWESRIDRRVTIPRTKCLRPQNHFKI